MIKMNRIYKNYKYLEVFKDISLTIHDGEIVRIKGDNGSGKSVLLKLMVGYSVPDAGEILIDDKKLKKDFEFTPRSGVFINAPDFLPNETGLNNLLYLASFRKEVTAERINELAEALHFKVEIQKKYKTYSLGMKQKMRLIQAIMEDNKYLFIDEPFDGLDQKSKKAAIQLLTDYMAEDKIIVYTSHSDDFQLHTTMTLSIDSPDCILVNA